MTNQTRSISITTSAPSSSEALFFHVGGKNSPDKSRMVTLGLIPNAASSGSMSSGSGVEYTEQLTGAKPKPKRRKIAGIDQHELLEPALLADPDSCFYEFKGLQIHYKACQAESEALPDETSSQLPYQMIELGIPMILLHGFGASLFSWSRVMKPLAHLCKSSVLAFDRPAFGLTSRVSPFEQLSHSQKDTKPLNPYSTMFSALATLNFIDFLKSDKAIIFGHSAGANVAVQAYLEAPDRVAALILVAPAILAPPFQQKVDTKIESTEDKQTQRDTSNSEVPANPLIKICNTLSKLSRYIAQITSFVVKRVVEFFKSLYKKALLAFLRSAIAVMLIRIIIDKFGESAVKNSWYDSKKITDHDLDGYKKPLRAKGWEKALLEFTAATLADSASEAKPASARLNEISCPVLILTGDKDRLVPSWNAKRLSRRIPGSCFEVIQNCGHLPHEEKPDEFLAAVAAFLCNTFGILGG
ncbi:bifunctional epoxide hydrolase 2 [Heracleum sosnowskyi]|uniref:Bifunctional epoxide hydrolase 2 n=1 Tax=Heracleum sosnowskyi TaxID=360622 RepID=A0AAD8IY06_9APIA|nr:bifunctional epoxide hydrolase 2 [Heracleum sosnowskyi]